MSGQFKYEKEYRVPKSSVPVEALEFVEKLPNFSKHKWYLEQGLKSHSYEVKTRIAKKKYSIEFDKEGNLEDAEILIKFKSLAPSLQVEINETILDKFKKYKIKKIQRQLSGSPENVISKINGKDSPITTRYELIIKANSEDGISTYELLMDDKGLLLNQTKIIEESLENLEF